MPERNFTFTQKMTGENAILRHWHAELQVFHQNFSLLERQMDQEAIHDLRVAIKKLRSYMRLHEGLFNKKQPQEMIAAIKEVFSVFGRHRNIDVARRLLLAFPGNNKLGSSALLVYLQLLQDQVTPYCQQSIRNFDTQRLDNFTEELHKDTQNLTGAETVAMVQDMVVSSVKTVKHDLKHFRNKSHLVRKRLKDIFYWSKIFDQTVFFTATELKKLNKILDHLGSIQDHEVLITNLKNFRKTILSSALEEYVVIQQMEARVKRKKEVLLEKAKKMTEEVILKDHN